MTLRTANRRRLKKRYGPNSGRRALRLFSAACWTTTNMHESVGHYREVDEHWTAMFQAVGLPPPK